MESVVFNETITGLLGVRFKLSPECEFATSYSTLQWARMSAGGELKIAFTHHTVILKGKNLDGLAGEFIEHRIRLVSAVPSRVVLQVSGKTSDPLVEEILVVTKSSEESTSKMSSNGSKSPWKNAGGR